MFKRILKKVAHFYNEGLVVVPVDHLVGEQANPHFPEPKEQDSFIPPAHVDTGAPKYRGVPIPKYPDHGLAVPAVPPAALIESQSLLIHELQQSSGLSRPDFDTILLPVIHNYACFAHLLPASESHHHCAQGGLFRHGLEVAYYASRRCETKVFALDQTPSIRKHLEPRWVIAAILGGLLHDVGKPLVDVGAIDGTGDFVWDPYKESLFAWLAQNELEHYYFMWRSGARHKRHEARTIYAVDRLVPQTTRDWLAEYRGQTAVDAMIDALSGSSDLRNPLVDIIKHADSDSVARDVAESRNRLGASGSGGVRSLAARIIRVMHDQIANGDWKLNTIGHVVWVTDEGVFAIYPGACTKAIEILRSEGDNALPNDASVVLDVLKEHGYLVENNLMDGNTYSTWQGEIHAKDQGKDIQVPVHAMRFLHNPIIPTTIVQPDPLRIDLFDAHHRIINPQPEVTEIAPEAEQEVELHADQLAPKPVIQTSDEQVATANETTGDILVPGVESLPPPGASAMRDTPVTSALGNSDPGTVSEEEMESNSVTDALPDIEPRTISSGPTKELRDRHGEQEVREELMQESFERVNGAWPPATEAEAREWFLNEGAIGSVLAQIAKRVAEGELVTGLDIVDDGENVHLRYPSAFKEMGMGTQDIFKKLESMEWTERDSATPAKGTVVVIRGDQQLKTLRLTGHISEAFRVLLGSTPSAADKGSSPPPAAFALGPYIDARMAYVLKNKDVASDFSAPCIRLAFDDFLRDKRPENVALSQEPLSARKLQDFVKEFAKLHKLSPPTVDAYLDATDNAYFSSEKEGNRKRRFNRHINPGYDRGRDQDRIDVILRQEEGVRR